MRTVTKDATGKEKVRIEVTKIEETALDASLCVVPAGYRKITEGLQR